MLFQETALVQLHGQRQTGLAAQAGQYAVRFFLQDYPFEYGQGERLDVYLIGHRLVGHDRRGVGIDEHDFYLFVAESAACLGACVVEFGRLSYGDGTGAYDEHFLYILVFRHFYPPCLSFR